MKIFKNQITFSALCVAALLSSCTKEQSKTPIDNNFSSTEIESRADDETEVVTTTEANADDLSNNDFNYPYVGKWRGNHVGSNSFGMGTACLLSPSWVITAGHVASRLAHSPETVKVTVKFPNKTKYFERKVIKAFPLDKGDAAIALLEKPVTEVEAPYFNSNAYQGKSKVFYAKGIGSRGGIHQSNIFPFHAGKLDHRLYSSQVNGLKAGDSGAPWILDAPNSFDDCVIGTGRGSGRSVEPSANKTQIEFLMKKYTPTEKVKWKNRIYWEN